MNKPTPKVPSTHSLTNPTQLSLYEQVKLVQRYPLNDGHLLSFWYDWFCADKQLPARGRRLFAKLLNVALSHRFDINNSYVFFKNNCPCSGPLRDDFRICDLQTGKVLYTVVPYDASESKDERSYVYGAENEFKAPLVAGNWNTVVKWFLA